MTDPRGNDITCVGIGRSVEVKNVISHKRNTCETEHLSGLCNVLPLHFLLTRVSGFLFGIL